MDEKLREILARMEATAKASCINTGAPKIYSCGDRLRLLRIDEPRRVEIENEKYSEVSIVADQSKNPKFKIVSMKNVIGINRNESANSWIELLFKLHKNRIFNLIEKDFSSFERYVNSINRDTEDKPVLIEVDDSYYIDDEGKHRLTIAKCLGLESIPALVVKP